MLYPLSQPHMDQVNGHTWQVNMWWKNAILKGIIEFVWWRKVLVCWYVQCKNSILFFAALGNNPPNSRCLAAVRHRNTDFSMVFIIISINGHHIIWFILGTISTTYLSTFMVYISTHFLSKKKNNLISMLFCVVIKSAVGPPWKLLPTLGMTLFTHA